MIKIETIKNVIGKNHKKVYWFCLGALFVVATLLHGVNMFKYPYYESDEGTYMSQAWSVEESGEMAPYVYWYDHPPFGWYVLGTWVDVLGGDWNTFGNSLNTGRAFMLVLHLVQLGILVLLARRITGNKWLALLAGLLYTVSPLAVYFQRRILLDNIMVTWILASTLFLHAKKPNLGHVLGSGLAFGLAVVTKVTAVMFGPALLYKVVVEKWNINKHFRTIGWLIVSGVTVALWFIYAMIKTEFFPKDDRVSLIGTVLFQASRGTEVPFWHSASSFVANIESWMLLDGVFLYFLGICVLSALVLVLVSRKYRFVALATLFYFYFLIRGGVVIGFYILPLMPFAILSFVSFLDVLYQKMRHYKISRPLSWGIVLMALVFLGATYYPAQIKKYLLNDETSNQVSAMRWIKENLPEDAAIMIDVYAMTELRNPDFVNDKVFKNADWYFKIAKDPEIRVQKYNNDWRNLDYVFLSHEMIYQSEVGNLPVVRDAIRNSRPLVKWTEGSSAFLDIQDFRSTNGDWAAIYKINGTTETQLQFAWNYYRDNFIAGYGQVIDPQTKTTTSEGQAYAMLRASLLADEDAFDGVWQWTQDHLQHRVQDDLLSWQWKDGAQLDSNPATDADLDAALALIFAGYVFENDVYHEDAQQLLDSIWSQTVVRIQGTYYLLSTEKKSATRGGWYIVNPSYFSPAHYRVFAAFDDNKERDWEQLAQDSYQTLERLRLWRGGLGLPTNWVLINSETGSFNSASFYVSSGGGADVFGFDASRVFWRVGLDAEWFDDARAVNYLAHYADFWESEWERRGQFRAVYSTGGVPLVGYQAASLSASVLSGLKYVVDAETTSEIYAKLFSDTYVVDEDLEYAYWGDGDINYYNNNWTSLGAALFNGDIQNMQAIKVFDK